MAEHSRPLAPSWPNDGRALAGPRTLLAGASPSGAAGNSVSTEVLLDALQELGAVGLLAHEMHPLPRYLESEAVGRRRITLGVQPFSIHGEALLGGWVHRRRLREWECGWAVNSRYAGALLSAGVPYAIWEATTTRDELRAIDLRTLRRSGSSGVGNVVHRALLPIGERIERLLYRRARVVLAMSDYTRERILETHQLPPEHVAVLPHPPTRAFLEALRSLGARPRPAGNDRPVRLLCVGRMADPRKNVELLLAAARRLRAEGLALTLTIIGPYTLRWLHALRVPPEHDGIYLAGQVDLPTLVRAYRSHDLLVVPSRQEGFGIVVAEAMHAEMPVVATRCGGPERVILESGGGLLTDHTPESLASAIRQIATDPVLRRTMSARAVDYATRELSPRRFATRVAEVTDSLVADAVGREIGRP